MAFGLMPDTAADITKKSPRSHAHRCCELSPNAPDIAAVARACEDAGADAISLVNTFLGMAVDVKRKKAVFNNVYAGLSGPAILPLALRMVHQAAHAVKIPVVGLGGIATAEDALKFLMAGARAVQIGSMTFGKTFDDAQRHRRAVCLLQRRETNESAGDSRDFIKVITTKKECVLCRTNLTILKQCEAFLEGHFLLSSGRHSGGTASVPSFCASPRSRAGAFHRYGCR
jgi:tRNA-dihydrouridine synthase